MRATAEGQQPEGASRARLRTRSGVWLSLHGSMLEGSDQLALIIEPAKAADVAPLIIEAYGFSQRELEVTRLIASGLGTSQIAAKLFLSPHTVRDHVKAVFERSGSRAAASSWRRCSPTTTRRFPMRSRRRSPANGTSENRKRESPG